MLTPVFSLKISSYYSGIDISLSPLGILNLLTNYSKWENVIGQGVTALLCAICATIGILSAIAAGFFVKSLIDIYNRSKASALEHSRFSIKMLLILNAICAGIVIIWNMFADSASQSSSDYFSSAAMKLMKMQFPVSAVVFIVLSIAAIIAINRFIGTSYMMDKQTQAIIQHENVWFCTKCGAKNREGDSFCSQCGHYK